MNFQGITYANFLQRFIARFIDIVILFLFWLILYLFYKMPNNYIVGLSMYFFWFIYYPILEANGGTFGKRLLNLKPVSSDTLLPITLKKSYKRSFFISWPLLISQFVFFIYYSIADRGFPLYSVVFLMMNFIFFAIFSPLSMLWSNQKQGWHDRWSDTIVIFE